MVEDILPIVKEEACGLRLMRKNGVRIELEHLSAYKGRKIPVVYNYLWVSGLMIGKSPR